MTLISSTRGRGPAHAPRPRFFRRPPDFASSLGLVFLGYGIGLVLSFLGYLYGWLWSVGTIGFFFVAFFAPLPGILAAMAAADWVSDILRARRESRSKSCVVKP